MADETVDELCADSLAGGAIDTWLAAGSIFCPWDVGALCLPDRRDPLTNAELLGYFPPVSVQIDGEAAQPGIMRLNGMAVPKRASNPQARAKDGSAWWIEANGSAGFCGLFPVAKRLRYALQEGTR